MVKPVALIPEVCTHEYRWSTGNPGEEHQHCTYNRKYSYTWAQLSDKDNHLTRSGPIRRAISWTTNPTREQHELIKKGVTTFETHDSSDPTRKIQCSVHHRDGFGAQIINRAEVDIDRFGRAVNIMRVCKQAEEECAEILYGENMYQFYVCGSTFELDLQKMPWRIPGFKTKEGNVSDRTEVSNAIEKLFDLDCYHPPIISKDRLIRFIAYIGRKNASLLRSINIIGDFKTKTRIDEKDSFLGFGTLLPTYTLIINEVCPSLRKLTLHIRLEQPWWTNDLNKDGEMTDEEIIDGLVSKVVTGLPSLQELQLGAYNKVPAWPRRVGFGEHGNYNMHEWGGSVRWMKVVSDRKRDQQSRVGTSSILPINSIDPRHIAGHTKIRSGSGTRYKDSNEHKRHGSYGTSNCSWTMTRCPCIAVESGHRFQLPGSPKYPRDQYGYLPDHPNRMWKCQDAHGGRRNISGRILNISGKVDNDSVPRPLRGKKGNVYRWSCSESAHI